MRNATAFALVLAALLFFGAQPAETRGAAAVVEGIQKKYASISDLSSAFTQETRIKDPKETVLSSGRVWFKKPAMMKWQYEKPWKDTIVSDGKKVRHFDSRENLVTETKMDDALAGSSLDSYTIISMLEDLDSLFDVRLGAEDTDGNVLLDLRQKRRNQPRKITIAVHPETYSLKKIIIVDLFGNTTTISLSAPKTNLKTPDSFFALETPEGAETATFPSGAN